MRIQLTDTFFIEQCVNAPFCWDLFRVSYGVRKGETVRVEKPEAFGFNLEHLIKKIADYEIAESNDTVVFEEYLKRYKEITESATKILINNLKR